MRSTTLDRKIEDEFGEKFFSISCILSIFILDRITLMLYSGNLYSLGGDFSMILFRDNKPARLMSHEMAAVAVRPSLTACVTRTKNLVIIAGWRKEAAP